MSKPGLFGWFKDIPISRKLYFTVGIMAVLIGIELFALFFSIHTISSVRAYVGGEGLWSKAQKDALFSLVQYSYTRNESDYRQFQEHMRVVEGDALARAELAKPQPDWEAARRGFIQGRNHPDDIDGMIKLFRRFNNVSYIHRAIEVWGQAEPIALQMQTVANQLHEEFSKPQPSAQRVQEIMVTVPVINKQITVLEDEFSYTLGEGSRWLEGLVLRLLFVIALTVEISGLFLAISVSRNIQKGLGEIIEAAKAFASGKRKARARVFSKDEIGQLADTFNHMSNQLDYSIAYLEQAEKKFRGLLESAPDAIVIVDRKGIIRLMNTQAEQLFGYGRNELLGQNIELLIPEAHRASHPAMREEYFSDPKVRFMGQGKALVALKKGGREFAAEISLSPLTTEEGLLVSAAVRDISTRLQYEETLRRNNQELQQKNSELEQFAYVASHDLQEPLRTVISFIELLQKEHNETFTETERQYMHYIVASAHRMKGQIKALLDYSRIGRGQKQAKVNVNEVLQEALQELQPLVRSTDATVTVANMPEIKGYPQDLKLLFQHLIGNALKFRSPERKPRIKIEVEPTRGAYRFFVSDNGIGIQNEYLDKIFIIFQRLHNQEQYDGAGIGLAHCRKIVEMHGGSIWADSEFEKGSTFYFIIPTNP